MGKRGRPKRDYSEIKKVMRQLRDKGLKKRPALHVLRHDMGYEIRDSKFYELAREIWDYVYVCAKKVRIKLRNKYEIKTYHIEATDYKEREVLKMIEDYKFEEDTAYDVVEVETWKSDKKEDAKYRLTQRRLMAIFVIIIKHTRFLSIENLLDITKQLIIDFYDDNVRHKVRHLDFLTRVLIILEDKEGEMPL
jgi:transposase-like protein